MDLDFSALTPYTAMFVSALGVTLKFTFLSLIVGVALGLILAIIKLSRFKVLIWFANAYTSIFRGVPLMVQLFLVYFATPQLFHYNITALEAGVLAFGLNTAALMSEVFRGGIGSVPKGQMEAASALGIPYRMAMKDVIIPQALKSILPSLVNESVNLLKTTSVVSTIGVADIMRTSNLVLSTTYRAFEPLLIAAIMYYVLVVIFSAFSNALERRLRRGD